jgi:hypothetical protein
MAELAAAAEAVCVREAYLRAEIKVLTKGLRERVGEQANAEYDAAMQQVADSFPEAAAASADKKRARSSSAGGSASDGSKRRELQRIAGFNAPPSATQNAIDVDAPRATRQSAGGLSGSGSSSAAAAKDSTSTEATARTAAPAASAHRTVKPPAASTAAPSAAASAQRAAVQPPAAAPTAAAAKTRARTDTVVSPAPARKSQAAPRFAPVSPKKKAAAAAKKKTAAPPKHPTLIAHYPQDFGPAYKGSLLRMRFLEDGQPEWCTGTLGKSLPKSKLIRCS